MKMLSVAAVGLFASIAFFAPALVSAATIQVSMTDDVFTAKSVTINAGDTIIWTNNGHMAHTVTADDGSFDSGSIAPGASFIHTYGTAGTFAYHCAFHGAVGGVGMSGTVVVKALPASSGSLTQSTTVSSGNTQSVSNLQAQVQVLTQLLAQLQQQSGASAAVSSCGAMTQMGPGSTGQSVTLLQQFLAQDVSIYPQGIVSGFYGSLTTAAVGRFQAKNGIVSSGTPATTGYGKVGPRTLAAIQAQCAGTTVGSGVGNNYVAPTGPVGGFIQVSPISGKAPLQVTVQATVNTTSNCSAGTYTLDYGDGSTPVAITVPGGLCKSAQQSYIHTYSQAGTFSVVLSAGGHSSSATVIAQ